MRRKTPKFEFVPGFDTGKPPPPPPNGCWKENPSVVINEGGVKTLRPDQQLACRALMCALLCVLNQPTASGKTLIMMMLCWMYLKVNPTGLVIIAVPQTQIGEGFKNSRFRMSEEDEPINWVPVNYLLLGSQPEKSKKLLGLLKGERHPDPMQRVIVCSHLTLVMAAKKAFAESPELFRNIMLVIDEAHHCRVDADSSDPELVGLLSDRTNALGRFVELGIKEPKRNLRLLLATATFFRGDFGGIVGEYRDSFVHHLMDYAEFFAACEHLKNLVYKFALYRDDWSCVVDEIWRANPTARMLVYIPYVQSECAHPEGKTQDVQMVWQGVAGKQAPTVKQDGVVTLVKRGSQWLKFVDLVDTTNREAKKQYIEQAHQGKAELDGIVCLGMFKEGANWQQADTAVIVGPRSSLTENVQLTGRLLRDFKGKETVTVYHCLPKDQENQGEQYCESRIKAITAAMVLEELYCPVVVRGKTGREHKIKTSRLLELAGNDLPMLEKIRQDITDRWVLRRDPDALYQKSVLKTIVAEVLKEHLNVDDSEDIRVVFEQTLRLFVRHHPRRAQLELLSTDDIEYELFRNGFMSYGITAPGLRRWRAFLADLRTNWFARFWSHLLEYLFGQHGYQLRCGLDTLGNHPPEEPVALTCPQGHEYSVAPQDFACGARCPQCGGETSKPPFPAKEPSELTIPFEYVSKDGFTLGAYYSRARRHDNMTLSTSNTTWLLSVGYKQGALHGYLTKEKIIAALAEENYVVDMASYQSIFSAVRVTCPKGHSYDKALYSFFRGARCPICVGKCTRTAEDVTRIFSENGYGVDVTNYKNAASKLPITCPEGHTYTCRITSFLAGSRCPKCFNISQTTDTASVLRLFTDAGYEVDLSGYNNNKTKLPVTCPNGHKYMTHANNFRNGSRCMVCAGKKLKTAEEVQKLFSTEGYSADTRSYETGATKLQVLCPQGHRWLTTTYRFAAGERCGTCAPNKKRTKEEVNNVFSAAGYQVDLTMYSNTQSKIAAVCPNDHSFITTAHRFCAGVRCPECKGVRKKTKEEIVAVFEQNGYVVDVTGYVNVTSRVPVKCPRGHEYSVVVHEFNRGSRCKQCRSIKT